MHRIFLSALALALTLAIPARAVTIDITGCGLVSCGPSTALNGTLDPSLTVTGTVGPTSMFADFSAVLDWGNELIFGSNQQLVFTGIGGIGYSWGQLGVGTLNSGQVSLNGGSFGINLSDIYSTVFSGGATIQDVADLSVWWIAGPPTGSVSFSLTGSVVNSFCDPGNSPGPQQGVCANSLTPGGTPTPAPVPLPAAAWLLVGAIGGLAGLRRLRRKAA